MTDSSLPSEPHQPHSFPFPKRETGTNPLREASSHHGSLDGYGYTTLKTKMLLSASFVLELVQKKNLPGLTMLKLYLSPKAMKQASVTRRL